MMQAVGRALATAILAMVAGAVCSVALYAWHPALTIECDRELPDNVHGFYPPERDEASHLTFAWTRADAVISLPGLDRRVPWVVTLRARGLRAVDADNPDVTVLSDGVAVATRHTHADFDEISATIPALPDRRGLTLGMHSSKTFQPGKGDPRTLGIMIDRLTLVPTGAVLLPHRAIGAAAFSSAAMGAAIALLGMTAGSAIAGAIVLSAAGASTAARGFAPFSTYPDTMLALGCGVAVALALVALAFRFARTQPLRNTARFAIAFTASALFLKLLVLLHPDMPIGDAMFHAHRFEAVLAGHFLFTSIAPGGYSFPYAPGLYVFASLFAGLVHRGAGDVVLLRIVTLSVDAFVAALLYRMVVIGWGDRLAAAISVALYHLIPLDFTVFTTGNLTNAFAQSVSVVSLVLMASPALRLDRAALTIGLALTLLAAYLSHASTFAILFASTLTIAGCFLFRGGPVLRSPALAIVVATVSAAAAAVLLYYGHFMDTYRVEFARIGHETATAAAAAGNRTIGDRARAVGWGLSTNLGWPLLALTVLGGWSRGHWHAPDRLALSIGGWLAACGLFLIIGVLTPVDMRYYLAAVPALAVAAAAGAATAWTNGSGWRLASVALLGWTVVIGVNNWMTTLG